MTDYNTTTKQSDVLWVKASKNIITPTDTTHTVCSIPANSLVTDIIVNKTTAYSSAGAVVTIGFKGNGETADVDAFMSSAVFDPTVVGTASIRQGSVLNSGGKHFTQQGSITVTSNDNAGTAGTFQIFVCYVQIKK